MENKKMIRGILMCVAVVLIILAQVIPAAATWFYIGALVIISISLLWTGLDATRNNKKAFGFMLMFLALLVLVLAYIIWMGPEWLGFNFSF